MIRIGILGDIGSGKSYVAKKFGYPVFNADKEVGKLYKKNKKVLKKFKRVLPRYFKSLPINKKNVSQAISGSGIKEPTFDELENIESIRKSLCYLNRLPKGTIIKENHLIALRPGDTVNPMEIDSFIGKQLIRDVDIYQKLNKKDFK